MRTFWEVIRWVCVFVLAPMVAFVTWTRNCNLASEEPYRVLGPVVKWTAEQDLKESGKIGDVDAEVRAEYPRLIGLNHYRILTKRTADSYDFVIRPTGWCFCRPTYILHDGGKRIEVIKPWLGR